MADQGSVREQARRAAAQTRSRLRAERAAHERERDRLAETVMVLLAERDAAVARCEREAGLALERLVELGLGAGEASAWCGGVPVREIGRLRQLARTHQATTAMPDPASAADPASATPDAAPAAVGTEVSS